MKRKDGDRLAQQRRYRENNKSRYVGLALHVAWRWFRPFYITFAEDVRQEAYLCALENYMLGRPMFLRAANRHMRLAALRYGWRKSNSQPMHREFLPYKEGTERGGQT